MQTILKKLTKLNKKDLLKIEEIESKLTAKLEKPNKKIEITLVSNENSEFKLVGTYHFTNHPSLGKSLHTDHYTVYVGDLAISNIPHRPDLIQFNYNNYLRDYLGCKSLTLDVPLKWRVKYNFWNKYKRVVSGDMPIEELDKMWALCWSRINDELIPVDQRKYPVLMVEYLIEVKEKANVTRK